MSSVAVKSDDRNSRSPTNAEQSQKAYVRDEDDSPDNELSPELVMVNSRKESHRASERVGFHTVWSMGRKEESALVRV